MRYFELLTESVSPIVYHYTGARSARNILETGVFQLSSVLGSVEQRYAPLKHFYFLSTTRTKYGGYHDIVGSSAVMFVLDGSWFNQRYPSKPVDYWENRDPLKSHHRAHEAEDRIFSKNPTIPIDGVTAIHVFISQQAEPTTKALARQTLLLAKKRGIKFYFYTDEAAWRRQDVRNTANISILTGVNDIKGYVSGRKGYLLPWIELIKAQKQDQLSKKADDIRYSLQFTYNKQNATRGLITELGNARKPNSGPDRKHAVEIINYMKQKGLLKVSDLVDDLAKKWGSPK